MVGGLLECGMDKALIWQWQLLLCGAKKKKMPWIEILYNDSGKMSFRLKSTSMENVLWVFYTSSPLTRKYHTLSSRLSRIIETPLSYLALYIVHALIQQSQRLIDMKPMKIGCENIWQGNANQIHWLPYSPSNINGFSLLSHRWRKTVILALLWWTGQMSINFI